MEFMSKTIGELAAALAAAQAELTPAKESANNPMFRSKYADLASCFEAIRTVLPKHKLAVSQIVEPAPTEGNISVVTILMHESGEWLSSRCTLMAEGNKGVNAAQAAGSAITYARRYGLTAIVGLATDDDDGNAAGAPVQPQSQPKQQRPAPAPAPQKPAEPPLQDESDANAIIQPGSKQFKALMARINAILNPNKDKNKKIDREDYLIELSRVLGRTVDSSKTLTIAEFHKFMDATSDENIPDMPF